MHFSMFIIYIQTLLHVSAPQGHLQGVLILLRENSMAVRSVHMNASLLWDVVVTGEFHSTEEVKYEAFTCLRSYIGPCNVKDK
jgi:hypothetical protein